MIRANCPPVGRFRLRAGRRGTLFALCVLSAGAPPAAAGAQVLEIDAVGEVIRHDGPSVITAEGETPIRAAARGAPALRRTRGKQPVDQVGFARAGAASDLSPDLLAAVAWRESNFRNDAASRAGAVGQMQLMPGTARDLGVDPADPRQNLQGGAVYLKGLLNRYHGDLERALAAYNAGPARVDKYGGVPPIAETQAYVGAVLARLSDVAEGRALSLEARTRTTAAPGTEADTK